MGYFNSDYSYLPRHRVPTSELNRPWTEADHKKAAQHLVSHLDKMQFERQKKVDDGLHDTVAPLPPLHEAIRQFTDQHVGDINHENKRQAKINHRNVGEVLRHAGGEMYEVYPEPDRTFHERMESVQSLIPEKPTPKPATAPKTPKPATAPATAPAVGSGAPMVKSVRIKFSTLF